jgi:hypothetical protein
MGRTKTTKTHIPDERQAIAKYTYNDYLLGSRQRYFSRDDFKKQYPDKTKTLVTETEILGTLVQVDSTFGCILLGEGGIGKTRMTLELGNMARSLGWVALQMAGKDIDFNGMKDLLKPGGKYLLLFDNIEESGVLDNPAALYEQLMEISANSIIKIVGNCRKSYLKFIDTSETGRLFFKDLSI